MLFIGIVFVMALLSGGIFEGIGTVTQTRNVVNQTVTLGAVTLLQGQAANNLVLRNATGGEIVPTTNYTLVNYDVSTGVLRSYVVKGSSPYSVVNATYVSEPLGYSTDAGARAVTGLIAIFAAVAVIGVIVWKIYDDGGLDMFK